MHYQRIHIRTVAAGDKALDKAPILRHIATFPYRVVNGSQIVQNYVQPDPFGSTDYEIKVDHWAMHLLSPHITRMIIA